MNSRSELALRAARPSLTNSGELPVSPSRPKVFVGMSGGVDSSVSALLLKEQGYDVTGIYMKNWSKDLPGMKCPWADDLADAKRVAVKLGIDFEMWDFENEYRDKVVDYMLSEFKKGNTPNPDIMCNQEIKFKLFYETAMEHGADFIATGHYARVGELKMDSLGPRPAGPSPWAAGAHARAAALRNPSSNPFSNSPCLLRPIDRKKDQTYFLYRISDEALARTIFPIGEMLKKDVKKLAEEKGLHNAYKKESMGVCFVGEVGMKDFLREYIDVQPGEIREVETEKVVGHHEGAVFYTIGQRHGLYISGNKGEVNSGLPYYVVKKDLKNNIVYVSRNINSDLVWIDRLKLKDVILRTKHAVSRAASGRPIAMGGRRSRSRCRAPEALRSRCLVRLRHLGELIPATLEGDTLIFEQKIKKPAAGQSAVFYDGEICLGGGIII